MLTSLHAELKTLAQTRRDEHGSLAEEMGTLKQLMLEVRERQNQVDEGAGGHAKAHGRLERGVSQYLDPYSSSTDSSACGGRHFARHAVSPFLDPVDDGARQDVDTEPKEEVDTEHTDTDGRVNIRKSISAGLKNLRKSSCEDSAEQKQRSPATEAPQEGSDVKKSALKSKPLGLRHRDVQVNRCEPCACS